MGSNATIIISQIDEFLVLKENTNIAGATSVDIKFENVEDGTLIEIIKDNISMKKEVTYGKITFVDENGRNFINEDGFYKIKSVSVDLPQYFCSFGAFKVVGGVVCYAPHYWHLESQKIWSTIISLNDKINNIKATVDSVVNGFATE